MVLTEVVKRNTKIQGMIPFKFHLSHFLTIFINQVIHARLAIQIPYGPCGSGKTGPKSAFLLVSSFLFIFTC